MRRLSLLLLILTSLTAAAADKPKSKIADTIRVYNLGEIVKEAEGEKNVVLPSTFHNISYLNIQQADALSFDALAPYIPSAAVKMNSRGESLISLRGAGERQIAVFFDGALYNVPWDNRIDLSFIPADIIGQVSASPGAASILYGANSLGGALNISTYERSSDGFGGKAKAQFSHTGSQNYYFTHDGRKGRWNYLLNLSYLNSPGVQSPDWNKDEKGISYIPEEHPFYDRGLLLANSDIERISGYGRVEYQADKGRVGFSYSHIRGEKGAPPERHVAYYDARYWRYPDWNRNFYTLNAEYNIHPKLADITFRLTGWRDDFIQKISSYENEVPYFSSIIETQRDNDMTMGVRFISFVKFNEQHNLDININPIFSDHFEDKYNSTDSLTSQLKYSQILTSLGAEYRYTGERITANLGAGFEAQRVNEAEPFFKPDEVRVINDYSFLAGIKYKLNQEHSIYINSGRKTRFPTLREQYSAALNRFVINPDLRAETGILTEAGWNFNSEKITLNAAAFVNLYDGLIARIASPSDPKKYMRVNLDKARIAGLEAAFAYRPSSFLDFEFNGSYMYSESYDNGTWGKKLEYRPNLLVFALARYKIGDFTIQAEADYIGLQYGIIGNYLKEITGSLYLSARASYRTAIMDAAIVEIFLRIDNIADEWRLSQLGLPDEGRTLRGGLSVIF